MTPDTLFSIASTAALIGWLVLIAFPRRRWAADLVVITVVVLFASLYVALIASHYVGSRGDFGSLDAVATLFGDRWLLLAGWVHYLAFDLLVGRWEAADAATLELSPWLLAPILGLTFMFGPAGWLVYMAVRTAALSRRAPRPATTGR